VFRFLVIPDIAARVVLVLAVVVISQAAHTAMVNVGIVNHRCIYMATSVQLDWLTGIRSASTGRQVFRLLVIPDIAARVVVVLVMVVISQAGKSAVVGQTRGADDSSVILPHINQIFIFHEGASAGIGFKKFPGEAVPFGDIFCFASPRASWRSGNPITVAASR
jgi:hypothetical protein